MRRNGARIENITVIDINDILSEFHRAMTILRGPSMMRFKCNLFNYFGQRERLQPNETGHSETSYHGFIVHAFCIYLHIEISHKCIIVRNRTITYRSY